MIKNSKNFPKNQISKLSYLKHQAGRLFSSFHNDERGLNAVEAILLLLVAVVIIAGITALIVPDIFNKVKEKVSEILGFSVS